MSRDRPTKHGSKAVVAVRAAPGADPDPTEIAALTEAAGYDVAAAHAQSRPPDPGTELGAGKLGELAETVAETGAGLVVVDAELSPTQTVAIEEAMPPGTRVYDRYRLVLDVFEQGAGTRRAELEVERARLQYELPRVRERTDEKLFSATVEKGSPIDGIENRIADAERKLAALPSPAQRHRERRRERGFDLVALAGYTNAGKSTLLHRLADELSTADLPDPPPGGDDSAADPDAEDGSGPAAANSTGDDGPSPTDRDAGGGGGADRHPDRPETAAVADRLFETLETTTRRATLSGRPTLVTDTVGFVDGLSHRIVESFSTTLDEVAVADAVVLVADAGDPPEEFRRKLRTAREVLDGAGVDPGDVVVALNKVDRLDPATVTHRRRTAREVWPAAVGPPGDAGGDGEDGGDAVDDDDDGDAETAGDGDGGDDDGGDGDGESGPAVTVSAADGTGVDALVGAVLGTLPTASATVSVPVEDGMSVLSWAHDRLRVTAVEYGESVRFRVEGRPDVLRRLRGRVREAGGTVDPATGTVGRPQS